MNKEPQKEIDRLDAEINSLRVQRQNLADEQKTNVTLPAMKQIVGKHFLYRDSYSHGHQWNVYVKILDASETCEFIVERYSIDEYGEMEHTIEIVSYSHLNGFYTPITEKRWNDEIEKFNKEWIKQSKLRKEHEFKSII